MPLSLLAALILLTVPFCASAASPNQQMMQKVITLSIKEYLKNFVVDIKDNFFKRYLLCCDSADEVRPQVPFELMVEHIIKVPVIYNAALMDKRRIRGLQISKISDISFVLVAFRRFDFSQQFRK